MNVGQTHMRLVTAGAMFAVFALIAGCGSEYRPVVTPVSPSGPAAQPNSLAIVVSAPSPAAAGIATVVDYAGDTIMATAPIGPAPISFTLDATGSTGYTVNSDGTLTNFPATTNLQQKSVNYTTLPVGSQAIGLFSPSAGLLAADLCSGTCNNIDVLTGIPEALSLTIPVSTSPVSVIGPGTIGERVYAITQGTSTAANPMACNLTPHASNMLAGSAQAIENSLHTISATIPVGVCPVYALPSSDNRRTFVLNRGSDTVTVINSQNNTLDSCTPFLNQSGQTVTCHPALPLSQAALTAGTTPPVNCNFAADPTCGGMPSVAGPVYAEYNAATSQLVVADYEGGTISVIDVSLDMYGNDSATFGTTYTIPVGNNPASVTVLADGSRAYTANQADGTVSIVNLSSHTVEKAPLPVNGHPRTVVSTQNSLYGKVYAGSPDSPYLTIIRTDQDILDTTVLVEGNIVDVRVTSQNGSSGNNNNTSRLPGYGQPCNLPPTLEPALSGTQTALQVCQTIP